MSNFPSVAVMPKTASGLIGGNPTYVAYGAAYTGYATPTDMLSLVNPVASGKILLLKFMALLSKSTASSLMTFEFHRRTSLNTGGTETDIVAAKYDSRDANPVGIAKVYNSAPVIHDANSNANLIQALIGLTALTTAAPNSFNTNGTGLSIVNAPFNDFANTLEILEGQEFAMNLLGAALPGGFTAIPLVLWAEYDKGNAL